MNPLTAMDETIVYRTSRKWSVIQWLLGGALVLGGSAGVIYFASGGEAGNLSGDAIVLLFFAGLALMGLMTIASGMRDRLTVTADGIEHRTLFRRKYMHVRDIVAFRVGHVQGVAVLLLLPKPGVKSGMDVNLTFALDERLDRWLEAFTNLDAKELAEVRQKIEADTLLGATAGERLALIERAGKMVRVSHWVSIGVLLWVILFPWPYRLALAVAAALPLLALIACWVRPELFTLRDTGRTATRFSLSILFLLPGIGLALRALGDVSLINPIDALVPVVVGALLLALMAGAARDGVASFFLIASLMAAYPAGVIPLANVQLDRAQPSRYLLKIEAKRATTGKGAAQYVGLALPAAFDAYELPVSRDIYEALAIGDSVCVLLHPGSVGMAWSSVHTAGVCSRPVD